MAEAKRYKAINFDFDTKSLIEVFGENKRTQAYSQIQRFLGRNGFEHRQGSGYVSTERMAYADVYIIIDALAERCSWLSQCTNRFDITDFMNQSDALTYIMLKQEARDTLELDIF